MGINCLHCCEMDAPELGRTPGKLNHIAESDGPQEPARRLGSLPTSHCTIGTSRTTDIPAVGQRGGKQGPGHGGPRRVSECTDGWRQQLPAEAGYVGSPQSAPVQPGTAGPCYQLCRRRGQSGIQEP